MFKKDLYYKATSYDDVIVNLNNNLYLCYKGVRFLKRTLIVGTIAYGVYKIFGNSTTKEEAKEEIKEDNH